MVSPDLNTGSLTTHSSHPAQSGVMHSGIAHDLSQLPPGQSYAGVNYLPIQQASQQAIHPAPMVAGDVFSNTASTGSTMLLDAPNGFDYALQEVRLVCSCRLTTGVVFRTSSRDLPGTCFRTCTDAAPALHNSQLRRLTSHAYQQRGGLQTLHAAIIRKQFGGRQ